MKRINLGLFSKAEEKFQWRTVAKLPSWVTPDMLSYASFLSFCSTGLFYYLAGRNLNYLWLVNLALFGHWLFDGIDGKLAQFRHHSRPNYGYYLDHVLDSIGVCSLLLGLNFSNLASSPWSLISFALILLLMMNTYLLHAASKTFYLAYGFLGGTEAQFVLIIINIVCLYIGNRPFFLLGLTFSFFDWLFFLLNPLFLAVLLSSFIKNISSLRKEKPQY